MFFSLPKKKIFTASFCVKNVLLHAVPPTIRIFPTNFHHKSHYPLEEF